MLVDGTWMAGLLKDVTFEYGIAEVFHPEDAEIWGTGGGYVLHSMSSQTKHPEEAWELMKILSSKDFLHEYNKSVSLVPPRKDVVAGDSYWMEGYKPLFVEVLARPNSRALPAHPKISELMKLLRMAIQKAALEESTPKAALDEAASLWNSIR